MLGSGHLPATNDPAIAVPSDSICGHDNECIKREHSGRGDEEHDDGVMWFPQDTSPLDEMADLGNSPSSPNQTMGNADFGAYPHCPIYILSKGRYELERGTMAALVRDIVPFTVVVEPDEADDYQRMLDHLVFRFFGFSGMVHVKGDDVEDSSAKSCEAQSCDKTVSQSATTGLDNSTTCLCCNNSAGDTWVDNLYQRRVSSLYHHGYVYEPVRLDKLDTSTQKEGAPLSPVAPAANNLDSRVPSCDFVLRSVDAIRAQFKVEVLPKSNKGVSYVRNYILHVLVPQLMVWSGVDSDGHIDELGLFSSTETKRLPESALVSIHSDEPFHEAVLRKPDKCITPPHELYGYYWVMDDDIYSFYHTDQEKRNERISAREIMRHVEKRLRRLRENAEAAAAISAKSSVINPHQAIFTCREDALVNNTPIALPGNLVRQSDSEGGALGSPVASITTDNYIHHPLTACYSLEYSRFAYSYSDNAMAINSYNNIACLFHYNLLHSGMRKQYFPPMLTAGVRSHEEVLVGYMGDMLWYRYAVREDYDFTLQLIARGLYTIRFRNLSFDVPQMSKVRGGMTDYYKHCLDDIARQNACFVKQWPSVSQLWVKGKNSTEREDIRVRWDLLHPSRVGHPGALLYLRDAHPQLQPQQRKLPDSDSTDPPSTDTSPVTTAPPVPLLRQTKIPVFPPRPKSVTEGQVKGETGAHTVGTNGGPNLTAPPPLSSQSTPIGNNGWKGYAMERWRDIHPDEVGLMGLKLLDSSSLHVGQTVAVIPPLLSQSPAVVLATLIERSVAGSSGLQRKRERKEADSPSTTIDDDDQVTVWTAVPQNVRGMSLLNVTQCYEPPQEGVEVVAKRVDQFFDILARRHLSR